MGILCSRGIFLKEDSLVSCASSFARDWDLRRPKSGFDFEGSWWWTSRGCPKNDASRWIFRLRLKTTWLQPSRIKESEKKKTNGNKEKHKNKKKATGKSSKEKLIEWVVTKTTASNQKQLWPLAQYLKITPWLGLSRPNTSGHQLRPAGIHNQSLAGLTRHHHRSSPKKKNDPLIIKP